MSTGRITDPMNREEFKIYIRSKLGEPVIDLNLSEFQVDQAVDEALQYYRDYHYNGTLHIYYAVDLTQEDIDRRYIILPDDIVSVVDCYDANSGGVNMNLGGLVSPTDVTMFELNYGYNSSGNTSGAALSIYMNSTYYDLIQSLVYGMKKIRFNMMDNKVHIDNSWGSYKVGSRLIFDAYQITDPDVNTKVWSDRWLIRYATAKLKRQWGENLGKFSAPLTNGITLNYERIINESETEIREIEENCIRDYSMPPRDMIQ